MTRSFIVAYYLLKPDETIGFFFGFFTEVPIWSLLAPISSSCDLLLSSIFFDFSSVFSTYLSPSYSSRPASLSILFLIILMTKKTNMIMEYMKKVNSIPRWTFYNSPMMMLSFELIIFNFQILIRKILYTLINDDC